MSLGDARSVIPVARMSAVDLVRFELRKAILAGTLPVGRPLGEVEIAAQLGVSRGPLREAAQRLVQEGLLVTVPGRGLHVRRIGAGEIGDLYEARLAVEGHAARLLVAAADSSSAIVALESALARLEEASDGDDAMAIGDADILFHQRLVDLAGSPRLSAVASSLLAETRLASLSAADGYHVRRSVSPTYRALLAALRSGDAEAATEALRHQFDDAIARLTGEDDSIDTAFSPLADEPVTFSPILPPEG